MTTVDPLIDAARHLLDQRATNARATQAYEQARIYYQAGDWRADKVPVEEIGPVVDQMKRGLADAAQSVALAELTLSRAIEASTPDPIAASIFRNHILADTQNAAWRDPKPHVPNPFAIWLSERTGKPLEPQPSNHPFIRDR